jgi:zinc/manganese transport system substrate-binding protein
MRFIYLLLFLALPLSAQIKVVSLHPLLTDVIQRVGGQNIEVIDLIGKKGDPHHFEPNLDQLKSVIDAKVYFVSGKGLEGYLPTLKKNVPESAVVIEVGESLPSIESSCDHEGHEHHDHEVDPHWWHSIENFRRATNVVLDELTKLDSDKTHHESYKKRAQIYRAELAALANWTRLEIAKIPKDRRYLATAHKAFGYFCKDYQFEQLSIQGVNREQTPSPKEMADLMEKLTQNKVAAIFPEKESNQKILEVIARDLGIKLGEPLITDGTMVDTYQEMVRFNVNAIVKGLAE